MEGDFFYKEQTNGLCQGEQYRKQYRQEIVKWKKHMAAVYKKT